jgi:hypothetical protein
MKTELQHLTDVQLLEEIKRQWYEKSAWDYELNQMDEAEAFSPANDYLSSDIEQHIERLEREYTSRGLELPDRWAYVAQFESDEEEPIPQGYVPVTPKGMAGVTSEIMEFNRGVEAQPAGPHTAAEGSNQ